MTITRNDDPTCVGCCTKHKNGYMHAIQDVWDETSRPETWHYVAWCHECSVNLRREFIHILEKCKRLDANL